MGPRRKKSRTNSQAPGASQHTEQPAPTIQGHKAGEVPETAQLQNGDAPRKDVTNQTTNGSSSAVSDKSASRSSWYGGSWRSKASPVAQIARESISVARGATSESSADAASQQGQYMHNSLKRPRKSIPLIAEATRVNASGSNTDGNRSTEKVAEKSVQKPKDTEPKTDAGHDVEGSTPDPPLPPEPDKQASPDEREQAKHNRNSSLWLGWWSRPDDYAASEDGKVKGEAKAGEAATTQARETPLPISPVVTRQDTPGQSDAKDTALNGTALDGAQKAPGSANRSVSARSEMAERPPETQSARGWFGLWTASQNQQSPAKPESATQPQTEGAPKESNDTSDNQPPVESEPTADQRQRADSDADQPRSAGWAFWSKDRPRDATTAAGTQKHLGEIAVADTPSQSHPEAAQFNEEPQQRDKIGTSSKTPSINKDKAGKTTIRTEAAFATNAESLPPSRPTSAEPGKAEAAKINSAFRALKNPQTRPNIILPHFRDTYPPAYIPTYWERIGQYLASSLRITDSTPTTPNHVALLPTLPKIKNAVAIGVHGYFPAAFIQKVLGQPTGTSIRFANYAASAIRKWTEQHQPDSPCEIEQVALEGEGLIADRVATLWKLLLNWLTQLRNADLILVAAHSQGVPVAIMLVAKLINLGCLSPNAKVGICAMAGVNLGPFADYKSKFYGASAAELFDFNRPDSRVSRDYASALDVVLRYGARITYIGSIDDQLVSLESSLFSNLSHPYVQRAVFVDGRLHAPDFITHLMGFALKLRNLGISDHGLIRELSLPLAGSIYGGEGHSRVYDDDAVYHLAIQFALETTDIDPKTVVQASGTIETVDDSRSSSERRRSQGGIPSSTSVANSIRRGSISAVTQPGVAPRIAPHEAPVTGGNANPYYLPWAMRGILEEQTVKRDMQGEVKELVRLFDDWKPATKPLKDVKFRLEAVKSKL